MTKLLGPRWACSAEMCCRCLLVPGAEAGRTPPLLPGGRVSDANQGPTAPRYVARRAALPADSPALAPWANRAPLLVLGSHAWNAPNKAGRLACGPERQARVLRGAASGYALAPASAVPGTACALDGLR